MSIDGFKKEAGENEEFGYGRKVLSRWQAPEFEVYERGEKWLTYLSIVLVVIIAYAVFTNSPVMAITFVLIGVVGYIYAHKDPKTITFLITEEGVVAGRELYTFDNIKSFWIFYEPHGIKVASLHLKSHLLPYAHIPIHTEDPVAIRETLLKYVPEVKQEPNLVDTFERLLRI
jgi:hypothetical protein